MLDDHQTELSMLDELVNDDTDKMTAWEGEFIESLSQQAERDAWEPTEKQAAVLRKIWYRVFG